MKEKFKIIVTAKKLILEIDKLLETFPKKERVLRDKLKENSYDILEYVYEANNLSINKYLDNRILLQRKILTKISMLDFFMEESYKRKYISEDICLKNSKIIKDLSNMINGWIKYEEGKNK